MVLTDLRTQSTSSTSCIPQSRDPVLPPRAAGAGREFAFSSFLFASARSLLQLDHKEKWNNSRMIKFRKKATVNDFQGLNTLYERVYANKTISGYYLKMAPLKSCETLKFQIFKIIMM